jgi:PAS domain S-box-containing protein
MPISSITILWAVGAVIMVFCFLALTISGLSIIHNRKIRESELRFILFYLANLQRLKESEAKFRLLFGRSFDPVVLLDEKLCIQDANETFCKLLNQSKETAVGLAITDLIPMESRAVFGKELAKCLASGIDYLGEIPVLSNDNCIGRFEAGATSLRIGGKPALLVSFRDIEAHKHIEDELLRKNATLSEIMTHIEDEKMKYKQQISAAIEEQMIPTLRRATGGNGSINKDFLKQIEQNLQKMADSSKTPRETLNKLSAREMEICNLIKSGAYSKDIANTLNLSELTIHKHRERIRKKLGIANKDISLTSFLRNN